MQSLGTLLASNQVRVTSWAFFILFQTPKAINQYHYLFLSNTTVPLFIFV